MVRFFFPWERTLSRDRLVPRAPPRLQAARHRLTAALATILAAALFACGGAEGTGEEIRDTLGQDTAAIRNHFWSFAGHNNSRGVDTPQDAAATACYLRQSAEKECSCVLVARNVVMTAAHCTAGYNVDEFEIGFPRRASDPWPGVTGEHHYLVDVDGDGNTETVFKWVGDAAGDWFKADRKYERPAYSPGVRGADISLIFLTSDVPEEVVQAVAPVQGGNVKKAIENRISPASTIPSAIAVGRGGGNPMRIGPMGRVYDKWDKCGFGEGQNFCPNTCQKLPEIRAESNTRRNDIPLIEHGDSGGPLFVYNGDAQRYEVVGVFSGWRTCEDPDVAIWAHTGKDRKSVV